MLGCIQREPFGRVTCAYHNAESAAQSIENTSPDAPQRTSTAADPAALEAPAGGRGSGARKVQHGKRRKGGGRNTAAGSRQKRYDLPRSVRGTRRFPIVGTVHHFPYNFLSKHFVDHRTMSIGAAESSGGQNDDSSRSIDHANASATFPISRWALRQAWGIDTVPYPSSRRNTPLPTFVQSYSRSKCSKAV